MQYGFSAPMRGQLANFDDISHLVLTGEKIGFSTITVSDHIVVPTEIASIYPYNESGEFEGRTSGECLEQLTTVAAIAAITSRLRILTSVMVLPHRNPVLTAKILATIDVLSGGRLTIGCGTGWMKEEFEAIGAPVFEERGQVSNEYIGIFKELWTSENPSFSGKYSDFNGITFLPKPLQNPHPPIWIGGESAPALRRAASIGDCWYPIGSNPRFPLHSPDLLKKRLERLHGISEEIGRNPSDIQLAFSANWMNTDGEIQDKDGTRKSFTGNNEQIAGDIISLRNLGIHYISLNFPGETANQIIENMDDFMSNIASLVD